MRGLIDMSKKTLSTIKFTILNDKNLIIYPFLLSLLFFGVNNTLEYATDTYATFEELGTWQWMLYENGRVFNAFIYYIIEKLQISNGYVYKLSYGCAILFLSFAIYIFSKLLQDFCKNEILCTSLSFITIANFYIIEYFLFIEKGLFMFAILLCSIATYCTVNYFKNAKFSFLILALFCLAWAVFIYQIILGLFVILCLPFVLKYSNNIKSFTINNLVTASLYSIPLLIAFLTTKCLFKSSRMGGVGNIFQNVIYHFPRIIQLSLEHWFFIPGKMLLIIFLIIIAAAVVITFMHRKETCITRSMLSVIYLFLGTIFTAFFPAFSGVTSDFWARTIYPYGSILGILLIYLIIEYNINSSKNFQYTIGSIIILIISCQYLIFQSMFVDRYKCNEADRYYCEIIGNKIQEYEAENNITIDTICFYKDKSLRWFDMGLGDDGMMTRAQSCGWSNLTSLNLYLDSNYQKGESLPEYQEYFSALNWDTYSDEQVIFEGNVLHLCVY